jgi:hypothetical protein
MSSNSLNKKSMDDQKLNYRRPSFNNRKIAQVKEMITNKTDNDIKKVLEYFNFNVPQTIEAFIHGMIYLEKETQKNKFLIYFF